MLRLFSFRMSHCALVGFLCLLAISGHSIAADMPARYAYTVNTFDNSLASYRIDAEGMPHFSSHERISMSPTSLVVHPSGRFVVTVSKTSLRGIGVYRIDPATGGVSAVPGSPFVTDHRTRSPFFIAFHPSGRFVFVASRFDGVIVFRMDVETGHLTQIPGSPFAAGRRTRSLTVHPSGRFVYATNAYSNTLSAYHVNADTGVLTPVEGAPFAAGDASPIDKELVSRLGYPPEAEGLPNYVTMHPSGQYLYVANRLGSSLTAFRINQQNGQLTPLPGNPVITDLDPYAVVAHPSGHFVYALSWGSDGVVAYRVDPQSGELTRTTASTYPLAGRSPVAMSFLSGGQLAYVANFHSNSLSVLDVDLNTGALSLRDTVRTRTGPWSIALAPGQAAPVAAFVTDRAFGVATNGALVSYRQQSADGSLKPQARVAVDVRSEAMVVRNDGRFVYLADTDGDRVFAYDVDPVDGQFTEVPGSPFATGKFPRDLTMDINGRYLYIVNSGSDSLSVYAVDKDSGALTPTRGSPYATGRTPTSVTMDRAARYALVTNSDSDSISVFRYRSALSPSIYEMSKYGSPFASGKRPVDLAIDPSGKHAYVVNAGSDNLSVFSVHYQSGVLTELPQSPLPTGKSPGSVVVHPSGGWVYVLNRGSSDISVYRRDKLEGGLNDTGKRRSVKKQARSLLWGAQGRYLYVLNKDGSGLDKYAMDKNSGALIPQSAASAASSSALAWPVFAR